MLIKCNCMNSTGFSALDGIGGGAVASCFTSVELHKASVHFHTDSICDIISVLPTKRGISDRSPFCTAFERLSIA